MKLVIQAFFPERRTPASAGARRFARTLAPHPATIAQRRAAPHGERPPHPATLRARPAAPVAFAASAASAQRKVPVDAFQAPPDFLGAGASPGEPLPPALRRQMERYFRSDFSDVRVHVGPEANRIGALAFTLGSDLYFAPEQYQPHTQYGRELIGHELTHVVQQRAGLVDNPFASGVAIVQDDELEAEADRHGRAAARGEFGSFVLESRESAQAKPALQRAARSYQLVVGAYLHEQRLPEPLAGHGFVAIEGPDGERRAFGYSPSHYGDYDPTRDLGRLRRGVEGKVHDDTGAFDKDGVRTRSFAVSETQARAAMAKISEYRDSRALYSTDRRECTSFVLDVARAAGVSIPEASRPGPRVLYEALDRDADAARPAAFQRGQGRRPLG